MCSKSTSHHGYLFLFSSSSLSHLWMGFYFNPLLYRALLSVCVGLDEQREELSNPQVCTTFCTTGRLKTISWDIPPTPVCLWEPSSSSFVFLSSDSFGCCSTDFISSCFWPEMWCFSTDSCGMCTDETVSTFGITDPCIVSDSGTGLWGSLFGCVGMCPWDSNNDSWGFTIGWWGLCTASWWCTIGSWGLCIASWWCTIGW